MKTCNVVLCCLVILVLCSIVSYASESSKSSGNNNRQLYPRNCRENFVDNNAIINNRQLYPRNCRETFVDNNRQFDRRNDVIEKLTTVCSNTDDITDNSINCKRNYWSKWKNSGCHCIWSKDGMLRTRNDCETKDCSNSCSGGSDGDIYKKPIPEHIKGWYALLWTNNINTKAILDDRTKWRFAENYDARPNDTNLIIEFWGSSELGKKTFDIKDSDGTTSYDISDYEKFNPIIQIPDNDNTLLFINVGGGDNLSRVKQSIFKSKLTYISINACKITQHYDGVCFDMESLFGFDGLTAEEIWREFEICFKNCKYVGLYVLVTTYKDGYSSDMQNNSITDAINKELIDKYFSQSTLIDIFSPQCYDGVCNNGSSVDCSTLSHTVTKDSLNTNIYPYNWKAKHTTKSVCVIQSDVLDSYMIFRSPDAVGPVPTLPAPPPVTIKPGTGYWMTCNKKLNYFKTNTDAQTTGGYISASSLKDYLGLQSYDHHIKYEDGQTWTDNLDEQVNYKRSYRFYGVTKNSCGLQYYQNDTPTGDPSCPNKSPCNSAGPAPGPGPGPAARMSALDGASGITPLYDSMGLTNPIDSIIPNVKRAYYDDSVYPGKKCHRKQDCPDWYYTDDDKKPFYSQWLLLYKLNRYFECVKIRGGVSSKIVIGVETFPNIIKKISLPDATGNMVEQQILSQFWGPLPSAVGMYGLDNAVRGKTNYNNKLATIDNKGIAGVGVYVLNTMFQKTSIQYGDQIENDISGGSGDSGGSGGSGKCSGEPCDFKTYPTYCRSQLGNCGPGTPFCNDKSLWTPECLKETTSAPNSVTTKAALGLNSKIDKLLPYILKNNINYNLDYNPDKKYNISNGTVNKFPSKRNPPQKVFWGYTCNKSITGAVCYGDAFGDPDNHYTLNPKGGDISKYAQTLVDIGVNYVTMFCNIWQPNLVNNGSGSMKKEGSANWTFDWGKEKEQPINQKTLDYLHQKGVTIMLTIGAWDAIFPTKIACNGGYDDPAMNNTCSTDYNVETFIKNLIRIDQSCNNNIDGFDFDIEGFGSGSNSHKEGVWTSSCTGDGGPTGTCYTLPDRGTLDWLYKVFKELKNSTRSYSNVQKEYVTTLVPMSTAMYTNNINAKQNQFIKYDWLNINDSTNYPDYTESIYNHIDGIMLQWYSGSNINIDIDNIETIEQIDKNAIAMCQVPITSAPSAQITQPPAPAQTTQSPAPVQTTQSPAPAQTTQSPAPVQTTQSPAPAQTTYPSSTGTCSAKTIFNNLPQMKQINSWCQNPSNSSVCPKGWAELCECSGTVPVTTAAPHITTTAPHITTAAPRITTAAPHITTAAPPAGPVTTSYAPAGPGTTAAPATQSDCLIGAVCAYGANNIQNKPRNDVEGCCWWEEELYN